MSLAQFESVNSENLNLKLWVILEEWCCQTCWTLPFQYDSMFEVSAAFKWDDCIGISHVMGSIEIISLPVSVGQCQGLPSYFTKCSNFITSLFENPDYLQWEALQVNLLKINSSLESMLANLLWETFLQVLFIGLVLLTPGNAGSHAGAIAGKRWTRYLGSCLYPTP